jgi:hypothetical protein
MKSWRLSRAELRQARTIAKATFDGFLQSDLMPAGMQAVAIIWAAAFLVGPSFLLTAQYLSKYPLLRRFAPGRVEGTLWNDRMLLILMSAGAIGVIAVVLWDTLFPARRDAFVLTPLPVPLSIQMLGRLGGVLTLFGGFAIGLNVIPAVTFPLVAMPGFIQMPRAIVGHLVSTVAADSFVFFGVTALQGVVILSFGRRTAARLAAVAQAAAVLVVLLALLFMTPIRGFVARAVLAGDASARPLVLLPLSWFLGLYEWIGGTSRPVMATLAWRGVLAGVMPAAATIGVYAFGYRRLLVRAVETPARSTQSLLARLGARAVRWVAVRRPEEQAIVAFTARAISRSGRHSMMMAIYVGVAFALVTTTLITDVARFGQAALMSPTIAWVARGGPPLAVLMAPLMLGAPLAVGVRIVLTIPAEMQARWIFQTTALAVRRTDAAVHKTMLCLVLPPVIALAAGSAAILWGRDTVAPHTAFCASLTLALAELLLLSFRGVPLTRPYVPGRSRILVLWGFYLSAFFTYTYSMAALERSLFVDGGHAAVLEAAEVFAGIAVALWIWRKWRIRSVDEVSYEAAEPDDQMFQGFNLSEIHAAQSVAARHDSPAHLK